MPNSKVKERYEFDEKVWVVSVLNTGSKLGGHAMLLVEGLQTDSLSIYPKLFIGQYDIRARVLGDKVPNDSLGINRKGEITQIKCHESTVYGREYQSYTSQCYLVSPLEAKAMIASIKEDEAVCERAEKGECEYPAFQYVGTNHILSEVEMGDNCASWCLKKLTVAGIGDGSGKSKPEKVAGGSCLIL